MSYHPVADILGRIVRMINSQLLTISSSNNAQTLHLLGVSEMFQSKHGEDQMIVTKLCSNAGFVNFPVTLDTVKSLI